MLVDLLEDRLGEEAEEVAVRVLAPLGLRQGEARSGRRSAGQRVGRGAQGSGWRAAARVAVACIVAERHAVLDEVELGEEAQQPACEAREARSRDEEE